VFLSARRLVVSVFVLAVGVSAFASASALAAAPEVTIEGESSAGVSATEARLEATINPGGSETSYHFEYGPVAGSYDVSVPVPGREVPAGEVGVSVSGVATGLTPGMTYHYRVVASNAQPGVVDGADAVFTTPAAQATGSPPACSNELRRAEQPFGLELPDCRAYEMVSPLETIGQDATDSFLQTTLTRAAVSGEAITYQSAGSFANPYGSAFENQFLSRRGADGWSTQSITLPRAAYGAELYDNYSGLEFTPELSKGVGRSIGTPLTSEAPVGLSELYLADFANNSYQWLSNVPDDESLYKHNAGNAGAWVMGASTDLSHVVFTTVGDSLGTMWEWVNGKVVTVDVANNGEVMPDAGAGTFAPSSGGERPFAGNLWHAVSSDGSRVFFTSRTKDGALSASGSNLYVRENSEQPQSPINGEECTVSGDACTIEASASQKTDGSGPKGVDPDEGSARYWGASTDGSKVLFTSDQELTNNANTGISDRQEVIVRSASSGTYTLTFKGQTTGPIAYEATLAEVKSALEALSSVGAGNVAVSPGVNETGVPRDIVTFGGALAGSEQPPMTANGSSLSTGGTVSVSVLARPGNDLYEYDVEDGKLSDLTADSSETEGANVQGVVQISEDGSYVYFVAKGVLAAGALAGAPNLYVSHEGDAPRFIVTLGEGVDNNDWYGGRNSEEEAAGPEVNSAVVAPGGTLLAFMSYRELTGYDNHDANTGELDDEIYLYDAETDALACASCNPSGTRPIGSSKLRNSQELETSQSSFTQYRSRTLLEDGALFFDSSDALVPHASDGRQNVYEYEDGHVYPISNVAGGFESFFMDASANGENVFFGTADQLLPQDVSNNVVVYDARVSGGFPVTVSPPPCDNGDSCKPPPAAQPSVFGAPGSATFSGAGNITPAVIVEPAVKPKGKTLKCKKGHVKKNGKCVKKSKSKKAKKSNHGKGSK
jgi:WD40-like Beta Propeller Repeat